MKKLVCLMVFLMVVLNVLTVYAINLEVSSKGISSGYVIEFDEPAIYELTIKNLGEAGNFEIYSLVGIDITHDPIFIASNETKKVIVELRPQDSLKSKQELFTFEYKIKDSENDIQKGTLSINILKLESAFLVTPENVNPNSEEILLSIKNNLDLDFPEVSFKLTSAFFDHEETLSFESNERKDLVISIDREKLKTLNAGTYLMNSEIIAKEKKANIESQIKFLEQEGVESYDFSEGFIIKRDEIVIKNTGNIKRTVEINTQKNIFSYLFTTTNIPPTGIRTESFVKIYTWKEELIPNSELKVVIKTNWFFPIIIIVLIISSFIFIRRSIYANLELIKKVSFVKTKGGQFALKVTLRIKAKNFIERIAVIDRLPRLVKLYNKFGIISPSKIDTENRKVEWHIESLNKDETRIFTYIIYSEIGVVGRFELPEAKAVYEREGVVKEVSSNRSFYVNEPRG